jgi:flagellar L-ring protein FlgH
MKQSWELVKSRDILLAGLMLCASTHAYAENLYRSGDSQHLSADQRAACVGDSVTVVIVQAAEATSTLQNGSRRATEISASGSARSNSDSAQIGFGGSFSGRGEVRRADRFVTQLTATVEEVMPNGDLVIVGQQNLRINGETTNVTLRGRIRTADLDRDNRVASNRIANALINYDGEGFVSRSARPSLINRVLSLLGIG